MQDGQPSRKEEITASHSSQPLCKKAGGRIKQSFSSASGSSHYMFVRYIYREILQHMHKRKEKRLRHNLLTKHTKEKKSKQQNLGPSK